MIHKSDDDHVRECYHLASSARAEAMRQSDPASRAAFFTMEDCWIGLAQSFQLVESLSDFGQEVLRRHPVGDLTASELPCIQCETPEPLLDSPFGGEALAPAKNGLDDMGRAQQHLKADDCIERQRALIAKLRNDGHATDTAEKILATMLHSRNLLERHRSAALETLALHQMSGIPVPSPPRCPLTAWTETAPKLGCS